MKATGIRVLVVGLFRRGNKILVARGVDRTTGDQFFRPIGGAVEFGETTKDALRREILEETGSEIIEPRLLGVLENRFTYEGEPGHEIVFVFDTDFESPRDSAEVPLKEEGWLGPARWIDIGHPPPEPVYPIGLIELMAGKQL